MAVIDSYNGTDLTTTQAIGGGFTVTGVGQAFIGNGFPMTGLAFKMDKQGTPTGNATISIYAHSGTFGVSSVPTGAALASTTLDVSTLPTTPALVPIALSGVTPLKDVPYVVAFEYSGGSLNNVPRMYQTVSENVTVRGMSTRLVSGSWVAQDSIDNGFYVYDNRPGSGVTPSPHVIVGNGMSRSEVAN